MYRYQGRKGLLNDKDGCSVGFVPGDSPRVQLRVSADRSPEESSYEYELSLSPEEVVACLLTLPATSLVNALKVIGGNWDLPALVPEVIKHLAMGAIGAQVPPSGHQVEDVELNQVRDTDSDEPEEEAA
jgi:hypothetical protein